MDEILKSLLLGTDGIVAYATVFSILLACGLGLPLPEDIALILGGYLAHAGAANVWVMIGVGYLGIIVGDSIIFYVGRRIGGRVGTKPGGVWSRIVTPEKRAQVQALFGKHGAKLVMLARFLPGLRAVAFFTAGSIGMRYSRFVLFDSIAAIASAPLFVLLGWRFGGELDALIESLKKGQLSAFAFVAVVAAGYGAFRYWKKRRNKAVPPVSSTAAVAPTALPLEQPAAPVKRPRQVESN